MAVKIRLARAGKKRAPFYHVVIADERHVGEALMREQLLDACGAWPAEVLITDVAGFGDRHDPDKLARVFDTVLA